MECDNAHGESRLDSAQTQCLDVLYEWRDRTARVEDESTGYLLSNEELLAIGLAAPTSQNGLLAVYDKAVGDPTLGFRPLKMNEAATNRQKLLIDILTGQQVAVVEQRLPSLPSTCGSGNSRKEKVKAKLLASSRDGEEDGAVVVVVVVRDSLCSAHVMSRSSYHHLRHPQSQPQPRPHWSNSLPFWRRTWRYGSLRV